MSITPRSLWKLVVHDADVWTFAGVTAVAFLIWLFAEAASLRTQTVQAPVIFNDPSERILIETIDPRWQGTVSLTLEGPAAMVQQAPLRLGEGLTIKMGAGLLPVDGEQVIDLLARVRAHPAIQDTGLVVRSASPSTVRVRITTFEDITGVPVEVQIGEGVDADERAAEPAQVTVRAPTEIIERLRALPGGLRVIARPPADIVGSLTPGERRTFDAVLSLPGNLADAKHITITPQSVRATLRVRARVSTISIPSAPVQLLLPPVAHPDVVLENPFVRNATLTGPSTLIEQVSSGSRRLLAAISLSSDEFDARIESKSIDVWLLLDPKTGMISDLPDGAGVTSAHAPIRIKIAQTTAPAGS